VHGGHGVEELRLDELQAGLEQLGADDHRHEAADEEHHAGEDEVHRADVLVIRREDPAAPAMGWTVVVMFVVCGVCIGGVFVCHVLYLVENLLIDGGSRDGRDGGGRGGLTRELLLGLLGAQPRVVVRR
jgi:hypothetical protein